MLTKIKQNFLFILVNVFLILAFLGRTFFNSSFKYEDLLSTDGLTIFSICIAFILNLGPKIKPIKKFLYFVLLRLNFLNIDYKMICQLKCSSEAEISDFIEKFHETVTSSGLYKTSKYDLNSSSKASYKIFHRSMASNITIKDITNVNSEFAEDNEEVGYWEISFDNVNRFGTLEKNIKFLTNSLLETYQRDLDIKVLKLDLILNSETTEFDITNKFELLDKTKYEKMSAMASIKISSESNVEITNMRGLTLSSKNKGDFLNGFDVVKAILIG